MMSSTLCVSAEQNCTSPFSTDTSSRLCKALRGKAPAWRLRPLPPSGPCSSYSVFSRGQGSNPTLDHCQRPGQLHLPSPRASSAACEAPLPTPACRPQPAPHAKSVPGAQPRVAAAPPPPPRSAPSLRPCAPPRAPAAPPPSSPPP
eukprot:scaffold4896_cov50-Phaeocystis_antarctica.AAC.1